MQTHFSPEQLGDPAIAGSDVELRACLQCDYCISSCPTYQIVDNKLDSSRGRIYLIKEMLEQGGAPDSKTVEHIDRCLHCLACMSTCPSSVHYMHLVDHARAHIESNYRRPFSERVFRNLLAKIMPNPSRLRVAMRLAQLVKPVRFAMPKKLRKMVEMTPARLTVRIESDILQVFPAQGTRQRRVALLMGCAQQVVNSDINDATIRILTRHGCEVVVPAGSACCGALAHHMGKTKQSLEAAANNVRAWIQEMQGEDLDTIVINTSGCGTVVKDYGFMLRNDSLAQEAAKVSAMAKDITELLSDLTLNFHMIPELRVAYHATCSLQFGQRIRFTPKKLLKAAGFRLIEPKDSQMCCGFAGTYHLLQTDLSHELKSRKVQALEACTPDVIAAGNIGCMVQIGSGTTIPIVHTVELLDWATGGPVPHVLSSHPAIRSCHQKGNLRNTQGIYN